MPITSREATSRDGTSRDATSHQRTPRKRNIASLVGGWVIAVGCFVLWILCASQLTHWPPTWPVIAAGFVVAASIGVWIRLADL